MVPIRQPRQFITQRKAPDLPGDFSGDKTVNFDDFFLFVDNFGKKAEGSAASFDLDKNGTVDFTDFFTFVDNFGKSTASKRRASALEVAPRAFSALDARGGATSAGKALGGGC